jgi:hypothetical protein
LENNGEKSIEEKAKLTNSIVKTITMKGEKNQKHRREQ